MTFIAFIFHPWTRMMRGMNVIPRCLADDLTVYAIGHNHEARFQASYAETLRYLTFVGAKPAPSKCYTFSTESITRFRLSQELWYDINAYVPVVQAVRDLGGQLYTTSMINGSTLKQRLNRAIHLCLKLAFFSWPWEAKQRVVQALILPMALYGCEGAPAASKEIASLTVAMAKAIGNYSQRSYNLLSANFAKPGTCFDPSACVLTRSVTLLRSTIAKHPAIHNKIIRILKFYDAAGKKGINCTDILPNYKQPCPIPGNGNRTAWRDNAAIQGPTVLACSFRDFTSTVLASSRILLYNGGLTSALT